MEIHRCFLHCKQQTSFKLHCYTMRKNSKVPNSPLFQGVAKKSLQTSFVLHCYTMRKKRKVRNSPLFQGVTKKKKKELANIVHVTLLQDKKEMESTKFTALLRSHQQSLQTSFMLHCYTMRKKWKVRNSPLFQGVTQKACKHLSCYIVTG